MKWYKKRTIFGNTYCLNMLYEFRENIITYFNNARYDDFDRAFHENETALNTRSKINETVHEVHDIILYSGISPVITYTPPPMIGGYRQEIDVLTNIFNMHRYEIGPNDLLDFIERSIGRYKSDKTNSIIRTINPFFWFGQFLDLIVSIPFRFLKKAGLSSKAIEESLIGKIAKFILYVASLFASVLTILQILGLLDKSINFIKRIL